MTYNYNVPLPNDLPSDNQPVFQSNFDTLNDQFGVNHVKLGRTVEGATLSNPCIISSVDHGLTTGDTAVFTHVKGINAQGVVSDWAINGGAGYVITVINENTFSIPVDSTAYDPYIPNSGDFSSTAYNYGYHTKLFFKQPPLNFNQPDLQSPATSLYPKDIGNFASLFFQKGPQAVLESLLTFFAFSPTDVNFIETTNGIGFVTPWGLIINMGQVSKKTKQTSIPFNFDLPKPFSMGAYCGILTQINKNTPPAKGAFSFPSNTQGQIKILTANLTTAYTFSYYYIAIGK